MGNDTFKNNQIMKNHITLFPSNLRRIGLPKTGVRFHRRFPHRFNWEQMIWNKIFLALADILGAEKQANPKRCVHLKYQLALFTIHLRYTSCNMGFRLPALNHSLMFKGSVCYILPHSLVRAARWEMEARIEICLTFVALRQTKTIHNKSIGRDLGPAAVVKGELCIPRVIIIGFTLN